MKLLLIIADVVLQLAVFGIVAHLAKPLLRWARRRGELRAERVVGPRPPSSPPPSVD